MEKNSKTFEVITGLRQGDALSPTLLNVALDKVVRSLPVHRGIELFRSKTILAYADDIMTIGRSREEILQKRLTLSRRLSQ